MSPELKQTLQLAAHAGITLHPALETLVGPLGSLQTFTREALPAGSVLWQQPAAQRLSPPEHINYPGQVDPAIALLHQLARQAPSPSSAVSRLLLSACETDEQIRAYHGTYLDAAQLKQLGAMHAVLPNVLAMHTQRVQQIVQYLRQIDPTLDPQVIENLSVNAFRLGWFNTHFTPLTQLFRRCGLRGTRLSVEDQNFVLRTQRELAPNSEVFINLGRQDIFEQLIHAREFDPELRYYIAFGARLQFAVKSGAMQSLLAPARQVMPIAVSNTGDRMQLQDPHALLMESGPSASVIAFFNAFAADRNVQQALMNDALQQLQAMNHASKVAASALAPGMQKYLAGAQRDQAILDHFRDWVIDSGFDAPAL